MMCSLLVYGFILSLMIKSIMTGAATRAGSNWPCHVRSQEAKRENTGAQLTFPFLFHPRLWRVRQRRHICGSLSSLVKPLWKSPHPKVCLLGDLYPIKLTVKVNSCLSPPAPSPLHTASTPPPAHSPKWLLDLHPSDLTPIRRKENGTKQAKGLL